jgi:ABC-2 type transport system ATP-binding protein
MSTMSLRPDGGLRETSGRGRPNTRCAGTGGRGRTAAWVEEPVLGREGLVRRFGDRVAVDGVGFEIRHGETYGLLGPNGAGKTTTISIVARILAPDAGTVSVTGRRRP